MTLAMVLALSMPAASIAQTLLEAARQARSPWLVLIDVSPMLDPVREDPRFTDLRRELGLHSGAARGGRL